MEKDAYRDDVVAAAGGEFFPLALETLGNWTPSSLKTLAKDYRAEDYHL